MTIPFFRKCCAMIPANESQPNLLLSMSTLKMLDWFPDLIHLILFQMYSGKWHLLNSTHEYRFVWYRVWCFLPFPTHWIYGSIDTESVLNTSISLSEILLFLHGIVFFPPFCYFDFKIMLILIVLAWDKLILFAFIFINTPHSVFELNRVQSPQWIFSWW